MDSIRDESSPPRSRVDDAYSRLRQLIVNGDYPPGSPLRHQELSEEFGISLIPLREAIRKLEGERLVESVPNKGARVSPISAADVEDVYSTRIALEQEALRKAFPHLGPAAVAEMRSLRDEMIALMRRDDPGFYDLHRKVHFAIYERSKSPWLLHTIEIVWGHTERHRRLAARVRVFVDEGDDYHGHIVDAIEAGDLEGALAAMERDLERTRLLLVEAYRDDPG